MRESPANTAKAISAVRAPISAAGGYLAACVALGIQAPFFPLFLADRGFSADAISLALALPMAIRLLAMPLAGIVSDRLAAPRLVLVALGLFAAAGFALVGLVTGVIPILLAIGLAAVFWTPIFPLLDAYALRLAPARAVGGHQQLLVARLLTRKPARDRPEAGSDAEALEQRVRHQARDAAIAVKERVNPEQPVVSAGRSDDRVGLAEFCVGFLEAGEEAR